jgi:hypothetical protein
VSLASAIPGTEHKGRPPRSKIGQDAGRGPDRAGEDILRGSFCVGQGFGSVLRLGILGLPPTGFAPVADLIVVVTELVAGSCRQRS